MPPDLKPEANTVPRIANGEPTDSLSALCARLHAQVSRFLEEDVQDDRLKKVQEQTRISMGVIAEALDRYTYEIPGTKGPSSIDWKIQQRRRHVFIARPRC